ncbi:MAG: hypothetical protein AB7P37_20485 [Ramlibacter sp.]
MGCIDRNPVVAAALGAYVGEYAALEFMVLQLVMSAVGKEVAQAAMSQIHFSARLDVAEKLIRSAAPSSFNVAEALQAIAEAKRLNQRRNDLIHGVWELDAISKDVQLTIKAMSPKPKRLQITANDLRKDLGDVRKAVSTVANTFMKPSLVSLPVDAPINQASKPVTNTPSGAKGASKGAKVA